MHIYWRKSSSLSRTHDILSSKTAAPPPRRTGVRFLICHCTMSHRLCLPCRCSSACNDGRLCSSYAVRVYRTLLEGAKDSAPLLPLSITLAGSLLSGRKEGQGVYLHHLYSILPTPLHLVCFSACLVLGRALLFSLFLSLAAHGLSCMCRISSSSTAPACILLKGRSGIHYGRFATHSAILLFIHTINLLYSSRHALLVLVCPCLSDASLGIGRSRHLTYRDRCSCSALVCSCMSYGQRSCRTSATLELNAGASYAGALAAQLLLTIRNFPTTAGCSSAGTGGGAL